MNNQRKIKAEIDKTHKKIREGFEVFQNLWDKVEKANDHSSKQRWTAELKKELKKLQRMRDQIKAWLSNGVIKDTKDMEYHKSEIESKMEIFKELEREVKTKSYQSGSGNGSKEDQFDPEADPEMTDVVEWLKDMIKQLEEQVEEYSETLESEVSMGKRADQEVVERFQNAVDQNNWHLENLEAIIDMCYDGSIDANSVSEIRDDVEYYLESHMDEDFFADEGLYDDFQRRAEEIQDGILPTADSSSDSDSEEGGAAAAAARRLAEAQAAAAKAKAEAEAKEKAEAAARAKQAAEKERIRVQELKRKQELQRQKAEQERQQAEQRRRQQQQAVAEQQRQRALAQRALEQQQQQQAAQLQQQKYMQYQQQQQQMMRQAPQNAAKTVRAALQEAAVAHGAGDVARGSGGGRSIAGVLAGFLCAEDAKMLLMASSGRATPNQLQIGLRLKQQEDMLNHSFAHLPSAEDSDCRQPYRPLNPMPELANLFGQPTGLDLYAPQRQFERPGAAALFEKFDTDTLFYIFYHEQGTYRQYLAAQELRRQSWRFHKKYRTWFQRHEDPRVKDHSFERGTYVYFDYESGWCQRIKADFRFEYMFLEDELPV